VTPKEMTSLLGKGHSMAEISVMCGKSRGAVAGAIYRYRRKRVARVITASFAKPSPVMPIGFQDVVEKGLCRYISGDPAVNPSYCSSKAVKGAYCEYHYSACHRKVVVE
jgi:hypothetical protein